MQSPKSRLEKFLKGNPKYKSFLAEIIQKEKEIINKNVDHELKEKLKQKARTLFDYDVENFKKVSHSDSKYKLELLKSTDAVYSTLEKALKSKETETSLHNRADEIKSSHGKVETKMLKIYRVVPTETDAKESSASSKILLLHGTKPANVAGILKTGFKPSQKGKYGPGVYLTDSINYAYNYGKSYARENGLLKKFRYIFVNQARRVDEEKAPNSKMSYEQYLCEEPFLRVFSGSYAKEHVNDTFGSINRRVLQGSFLKDKENEIIATAHHSLVVPAYLIEAEEKLSVKEIVDKAYSDSLSILVEKTLNRLRNSSTTTNISRNKLYGSFILGQFSSLTTIETTKDVVTKELENEFIAEGQQNVKFYVTKLDEYINDVMEQLSFEISSITEAEHKDNLKYKTGLLKPENVDFDFILSLLKKGNKSQSIPSVTNIFKISPTAENESAKLKREYLFFNGVKSSKVRSVLSGGYTQCANTHSEPFDFAISNNAHKNDIYKATLNLEKEISKGSSYYTVDEKVKKLSFVFISTAGDVSQDPFLDAKVLQDSRGSCFDVNLTVSNRWEKNCKTPAYLIVFELNEQDCLR